METEYERLVREPAQGVVGQSAARHPRAPVEDEAGRLRQGMRSLRPLGDTLLLNTLTISLRVLAKRWLGLADELRELDAVLEDLTHQHAFWLRAQFGIGPQTAAILISVAGDNPERLRSEAALAALCGVSPLEASSGKIVRHRLNRGGDRCANNALWTITMVRMRAEPSPSSAAKF